MTLEQGTKGEDKQTPEMTLLLDFFFFKFRAQPANFVMFIFGKNRSRFEFKPLS